MTLILKKVDDFDPDIIVVGGKISNAWKFFSKSMKDTVKKIDIFH